MAITNYERVGKAMELLRDGLQPFVERELRSQYSQQWFDEMRGALPVQQMKLVGTAEKPNWDVALILSTLWEQWNAVFSKTLGRSERSIVSELRDVRNRWAHQNAFTTDDTYRALDSVQRLLLAVSAPQSDEIEKAKWELMRVRFDDQMRGEKRKSAGGTVESQVTGTLKPWREVISPHKDVASGRYQQAEFAADLWQVHLGEGSPEYKDPKEFFRRTYLTASLSRLLADAVERLNGTGGDPVVQLQTNFGGGKTHSMLALYHLCSGSAPGELLGIDKVMEVAGEEKLPKAKRVVIVGNKISPGRPSKKPDGTVVRTIWGEIAWQLGGKAAFARIKEDDERATNPGDAIRELLNEYGPALILIDEWVAYARQLHDQSDLPGGGFETQFSFAQALTESVKLAKSCMLVVSLPASDDVASPHAHLEDIEVGGVRGREALERLRNVIGRVESSWRPATPEEGFEIVRRRLFEPLIDPDQFKFRDLISRAFYDSYRTQPQEFPPEASKPEYEERLKAAYPIHPEVFDRLYNDWSSMPNFQRTRGVLRLMAAVIHCLWERGDRNPLILPCNIPLDDQRVQFEFTRYLSDNWTPVMEKDVDGVNALPLKIDGEIPNLGRYHASRRVARTIYLGSAPTTGAANRGLEDRRVKLGSVMPGESPNIFGDALRRLSGMATYLYSDGQRYYYSTQPTVTKLADDRAEQLRREPDKVLAEVERRLKSDLQNTSDFRRAHIAPQSGADVQDDYDARLVVLSPERPYSKGGEESAAEQDAKAILDSRGNAPRIFRNSLAFLGADKTKLQDLEDAVRRFLAWQEILEDKEKLELLKPQVNQAQTQLQNAEESIKARLPEAYQWLLVPIQNSAKADIQWQVTRLSGQDPLAVRASKRLKTDELLLTSIAPSRLRMELDRVPLWRGTYVSIRQLIEDFAKYIYLPRLVEPRVLTESVQKGLELLSWQQDSFAYADSFDEATGRFRGLVFGKMLLLAGDANSGIVIRSEAALQQAESEANSTKADQTTSTNRADGEPNLIGGYAGAVANHPKKLLPNRFHGSVTLDSSRVGRDAGRIADEIVSHLVGLMGSDVRVVLEIEASVPDGAGDEIVRIVTENARTLKFDSLGFETD